MSSISDNQCLKQIAMNFGVGASLGASVGAVYGTVDAFRFKIPGLLKIRHIGKTTVSTGAIFGTFLAAGALLHCGKH
ncbi:hypothetical protein HYH02_014969 [Chlamydomonas schloesseri]|uniref:Reactive oxygen species modulator 1 n=1 Tax=Chlamydomonas schloesseri TaxID=2026947 RepID=A0A835SEG4_9CHLO|nr:hypothetical protein HYH02_014969 [Chlamydomonas schloesseri]|eukprot:KAG2425753.1 hypothetical protein HYH02_014969 [Chlamydomonas schloesseri]